MKNNLTLDEMKILQAIEQLSFINKNLALDKKEIIIKAGYDITKNENNIFNSLKEKGLIDIIKNGNKNNYILKKKMGITNKDIEHKLIDISDEEFLEKLLFLANKEGIIDISSTQLIRKLGCFSYPQKFYKHIKVLIDKQKIDKFKVGRIIKYKINNIKNTDNESLSIKNLLGEFNNINIQVFDSKIGKVVPLQYIYKALEMNRQTLYNYIYNNMELLKGQTVKIRFGKLNINQICLTKDAILAILMKINYNSFDNHKKELILNFQKWIVEKMGKLISTGNISISQDEQKQIKSNIGKIINLKENDIDKLFEDVEDLITDKLHILHSKLNEYKEECEVQESNIKNYKEREKMWVNKIVNLREKIYSIR